MSSPVVRRFCSALLPTLVRVGLPAWCGIACEPPVSTLEEAVPTSLARHQERPREAPPEQAGLRVTYKISRGGTLRNVANLYKLFHHEIIELNPVVDPDQELEPNTEVLVFNDSGKPSESVGLPYEGELLNGLPMVEGPGRKITAERWKTWGTRSTVQQLDRALRRWAQLESSAPPVLVGNLSSRDGGPLSPHKSHQSGRDVDLSYIVRRNGNDPMTWQRVSSDNLDAELTWRLVKLLTQEAQVEVIYMDRSIQRVLLEHAKQHGTIRKGRLPDWLEIAGSSETSLIRHVPGHKDHFHVRLACPTDNRRCR